MRRHFNVELMRRGVLLDSSDERKYLAPTGNVTEASEGNFKEVLGFCLRPTGVPENVRGNDIRDDYNNIRNVVRIKRKVQLKHRETGAGTSVNKHETENNVNSTVFLLSISSL